MPSKLSIHIRDYPSNIWDKVSRMQPRVVKVFNHTSDMNIDTLKIMAKPLVIFRQFTTLNDFQKHSADEFVAELEADGGALRKLAGKGILWEGINEPGIGKDGTDADRERALALNRWYLRFAELMHQRNEKVAGFSWSTGNPTDKQLKWIVPLVKEAAAAVDAHAFHEYAKPRSPKPESDWGRYRLFERLLPENARKPVVITEAGVDDIGDANTSGWAAHMSAAEYRNLLARYDDVLAADNYVLGATIYTLKDPDWRSFDIDGEMLGRLADYMAEKGGGTVLGPVWPVPDFSSADKGAEIEPTYAFAVEPAHINAGQTATLRWQVEGATGVFLNGEQVSSRGERVVAPQRTTVYRLHVDFADRSYKELEAAVAVNPVALNVRIVDRAGAPVPGAVVRLFSGESLLGGDPRAVVGSRGAVTWTRRVTGFAGSLWNAWQKFIARDVAGITWEEFRREAPKFNPDLLETGGELRPTIAYFLPENRVFADTRASAPATVWDRQVTGIEGSLWDCWQRYVQGKVVGLTWDGFRDAMVAENPGLAALGRFRADQVYRLPRNADQDEYYRLAYASTEGKVTFEGLAPGTYRLEINADDHVRNVRDVEITGDQTESITLEWIAIEAERAASGFVAVQGRGFVLDGRPFRFIGVNLRGLAHYGTSKMPSALLSQQVDQLKEARAIGARVVRIFLPDADASTDEIIDRLKKLIGVMNGDARFQDMYLIVALTNLYKDVRFHIPGDDDAYDGQLGDRLGLNWFQKKGSDRYREFIRKVVTAFKYEPRIMAYDIGNELKAESRLPDGRIQGHPEVLIAFMHEIAALIRRLDGHTHLITTGMISTRHAHMLGHDNWRLKLYQSPNLDFVTNHAYHDDDKAETPVEQDNDAPSREDDYDIAERLGKPIIIEEAGFKHTESRRDRTGWFANELELTFDKRKTAGYMPWGFMKGGDNGDGNTELGLDDVFHVDWGSISDKLRKRADSLHA